MAPFSAVLLRRLSGWLVRGANLSNRYNKTAQFSLDWFRRTLCFLDRLAGLLRVPGGEDDYRISEFVLSTEVFLIQVHQVCIHIHAHKCVEVLQGRIRKL